MSQQLKAAFLFLGLALQAQEAAFEMPLTRGVSVYCPFVEGEFRMPRAGLDPMQKPVRLLFDTGAEVNLLQPLLGDSLGGTQRVPGELSGARGGNLKVNRRWTLTGQQRLKLGSMALSNLTFYPLPESLRTALERGDGLPMDGLLGIGDLAVMEPHLLVEVDPEQGRLRFHREDAFPLADWVMMPTIRRGARTFAHLTIAGRAVEALVDTGFAGGLELCEADAKGLPFASVPPEAFQVITMEGTTQAPETLFRLTTDVQWGKAKLAAVPVDRSLHGGQRSLLGARFWMANRWVLDPFNGRLWLPKEALAQLKFLPSHRPRWGFQVDQVNAPSEVLRELRITHVRAGSPADLGGLKVGDLLCGLETLQGEALSPVNIWPLLREPSKLRLSMVVEREGKRLELTLAKAGTS